MVHKKSRHFGKFFIDTFNISENIAYSSNAITKKRVVYIENGERLKFSCQWEVYTFDRFEPLFMILSDPERSFRLYKIITYSAKISINRNSYRVL